MAMLSSSRVRDVDGGWIPVIGNGNRDEGGKIHRARLRSGDETIFTLFIDNLPEDVSHSWLKKLFSNYGVVIDAFIPEKRSKVTGRKFGFIRYNCSISAEVAISKVNGLWCGDKKLYVKHASFNQNQQRQSAGENVRLNNNVGIGASYRNGQDREVRSSSHCENYFQGAVGYQSTAFKSTGGFKSFAQILKGDNCEIVEKSHEKATLNIIPVGNGWLNRSAVAKSFKRMEVEELKMEIAKEYICDIHIRSMGGRFFLLSFSDASRRDSVIQDTLMRRWFSEISPWNGEPASLERCVWLTCSGMPLNVWNLSTFKRIGELWGVFLGVDESTMKSLSFEKGRVLIATESSSIIDERISLEINGVLHHVKILEDQNFISQVWDEKMDVRSPDISSASSDSKDIDSLVEESPVGKAENIKQCPPKDIALGEDDDHMDNSKTKDNDMLVTVDDEDSIENVNCEEAAVSENSDCDAVDCSITNGVGNIDDGSQPNFTDGFVADSMHSNSIVVEDPALAVTNKDKEVVEFDQGFWNLSEVGFFNEKDLQGIELVVELNPTDVVEDIGKGKWKHKRIEDKLGYPKPKKKGRRKQKKCVVFRSAIAAAALSVSSDGINKIHLNAAQASRSISKILDEDYLGEDDEIISNFSVAT